MVKKDKNGSIGPMEFYEARKKLRTMDKVDLLGLASKQRGISRCAIGGEACGLYFCYEGWGFCVSEILGQGCQVQWSKTLEKYLSGSPAISQKSSSVLTVSAMNPLSPTRI